MLRVEAAEAAQRRPGCAVGSGTAGLHAPRVQQGFPALPLGQYRPHTTPVSARARAQPLLQAWRGVCVVQRVMHARLRRPFYMSVRDRFVPNQPLGSDRWGLDSRSGLGE